MDLSPLQSPTIYKNKVINCEEITEGNEISSVNQENINEDFKETQYNIRINYENCNNENGEIW